MYSCYVYMFLRQNLFAHRYSQYVSKLNLKKFLMDLFLHLKWSSKNEEDQKRCHGTELRCEKGGSFQRHPETGVAFDWLLQSLCLSPAKQSICTHNSSSAFSVWVACVSLLGKKQVHCKFLGCRRRFATSSKRKMQTSVPLVSSSMRAK